MFVNLGSSQIAGSSGNFAGSGNFGSSTFQTAANNTSQLRLNTNADPRYQNTYNQASMNAEQESDVLAATVPNLSSQNLAERGRNRSVRFADELSVGRQRDRSGSQPIGLTAGFGAQRSTSAPNNSVLSPQRDYNNTAAMRAASQLGGGAYQASPSARSSSAGMTSPSFRGRASDRLVPVRVNDPAMSRAFSGNMGGFRGAMALNAGSHSYYGGKYAAEEAAQERRISPPQARALSIAEEMHRQQMQQQMSNNVVKYNNGYNGASQGRRDPNYMEQPGPADGYNQPRHQRTERRRRSSDSRGGGGGGYRERSASAANQQQAYNSGYLAAFSNQPHGASHIDGIDAASVESEGVSEQSEQQVVNSATVFAPSSQPPTAQQTRAASSVSANNEPRQRYQVEATPQPTAPPPSLDVTAPSPPVVPEVRPAPTSAPAPQPSPAVVPSAVVQQPQPQRQPSPPAPQSPRNSSMANASFASPTYTRASQRSMNASFASPESHQLLHQTPGSRRQQSLRSPASTRRRRSSAGSPNPQQAETIKKLEHKCMGLERSLGTIDKKHSQELKEKDREIIMLRAALALNSHGGPPAPMMLQDPTSTGRKGGAPPHAGGLPFKPIAAELDSSVLVMHGYLQMLDLSEPKIFKRGWKRRYVLADDRGLRIFKEDVDVKLHKYQNTYAAAWYRDLDTFVPYFHASTAAEPTMYHPHANDLSYFYFGFVAKQPIGSDSGSPVNPALVFRTESSSEHEDWAHFFARSFNPKLYKQQFPTIFPPEQEVAAAVEEAGILDDEVEEPPQMEDTAFGPDEPMTEDTPEQHHQPAPPTSTPPPTALTGEDQKETEATPAMPPGTPPPGALVAGETEAEAAKQASRDIEAAMDEGDAEEQNEKAAEQTSNRDSPVHQEEKENSGELPEGKTIVSHAANKSKEATPIETVEVQRPTPSTKLEMQRLQDELGAMKLELARTLESCAELRETNAKQTVDLAAKEKLNDELEELRGELEKVSAELAEEREDRARHLRELSEKTIQLAQLEEEKANFVDDRDTAEDFASGVSEALQLAKSEVTRLRKQLDEAQKVSVAIARKNETTVLKEAADDDDSSGAESEDERERCDAATQFGDVPLPPFSPPTDVVQDLEPSLLLTPIAKGAAANQAANKSVLSPLSLMTGIPIPAPRGGSTVNTPPEEGAEEDAAIRQEYLLLDHKQALDELETVTKERDSLVTALQRQEEQHTKAISEICAKVINDMDEMHGEFVDELEQREEARERVAARGNPDQPMVVVQVQREQSCNEYDDSQSEEDELLAAYKLRCSIDETVVELLETRGDNSRRVNNKKPNHSLFPTKRGYTFHDVPTGTTMRLDMEIIPSSVGLRNGALQKKVQRPISKPTSRSSSVDPMSTVSATNSVGPSKTSSRPSRAMSLDGRNNTKFTFKSPTRRAPSSVASASGSSFPSPSNKSSIGVVPISSLVVSEPLMAGNTADVQRALSLRGPNVQREWHPSKSTPTIPHTSPVK